MPQPSPGKPFANGLIRIEAPHFVAGAVILYGRCVRAAPIIRKATVGKTAQEVVSWAQQKGYTMQLLD
jgi:hypothetical protein